MHANSSPVSSSQTTIHEHLAQLVARHAAHRYLKPVMPYNRAAFDAGMSAWHAAGRQPLIIDSGCGVGLSSMHLAASYPDHFVLGVDQSADRIGRNTLWPGPGSAPPNYLLLRADMVDFWRLLHEAGVRPARQYMLYPNPWPKVGHLARRWHGHPIFPTVVALGGILEVRSNWRIYIEEFHAALQLLMPDTPELFTSGPYLTTSPITPFERKYLASGHQLWHCVAQLTGQGMSKPVEPA
jgi:tRNA (guanine-N7-)-methyltransferase